MSLKQPTVIQHHAIPQIMEGHDVYVFYAFILRTFNNTVISVW